jgi:hypothetical protein
MAILQTAGLLKTDTATLEKQIDKETGTFYLTPADLQSTTAATRSALKISID